ncbi:hypothetical protein Q8A67_011867 [Cirrhinus molitorella]|uniref:G-protein coupled receptors family 1 profile domain-containing protein n=1 Tax=Cirrhinus molitorella TaxID=172907 RepID=A0AA88PNJ6_9TELE|nr:hypothetical protein Q8A67_011867 [Cirrhinus molitorella]
MHELFLSIVDKCNDLDYSYVRLPIESLTFVLGFPSNVALLWLLLRGEKALSPSDVLGLNLAVLNIIFCISLPLDVYVSVSKRAGDLLTVSEAISILNLIGCPLLLTSMCVERYLAAAHAVLYMKLGNNWEYRVVCSALIWIVTLGISVITFQQRLPKLAMYLSITLDAFLLIMLACLTGIVHVLRQKGPGEGQTGGRGGSTIKGRALKNALLILVPSAVIYGPLLATAPKTLPSFPKSVVVRRDGRQETGAGDKFGEVAEKLTQIVDNGLLDKRRVDEGIESDGDKDVDQDVIEKLVDLLKKSGDDLNERILSNHELLGYLQRTFSYNFFKRLTDAFITSVVPEYLQSRRKREQIAMTFEVTSRLNALDLHPMNRSMGYGAQYLQEYFALWVNQHGGWEKAFDDHDDEEVH